MRIAIWTDNDLDGAGSAIALKCLYGDKIKFIRDVNDYDFIGTFKGWIQQNYDLYDTIYITDLFIPDELIEFVDKEKIVVVDHHASHVEVRDRLKTAKYIIEDSSSCVSLILKKFGKVLMPKLTEAHLTLFRIIDDYDSYQLKYSESLKLNAVYHSYNKPKVEKFIERFGDGMVEFNTFELNAIKLYFNRYKDQIDRAEFFEGSIKGCKVISCCADTAINEVAHYAIAHYKADIAIIIMLNTKSVSFRKGKTCDIKLNKLAELLCGGGGHEYAAGGKFTEQFLTFTKTLIPCT